MNARSRVNQQPYVQQVLKRVRGRQHKRWPG